MADGSALSKKDLEADTSVAAKPAKGRRKKPALRAAIAEPKRARYRPRKFKVDLWATDLNTTEIGILKRTRQEAASDQFTKDMEIYGQTLDGGRREGILAYRKSLWEEKEGFERRLVIKLFSESLSWRGTLEMLVGRSLQLTRGTGVSVPAFSINLARHDQLIEVERCARKLPFMPERFTFFLQTKTGPQFYSLRRKVFAFGQDFVLFDQQHRKIGYLDSKIINLGGAWKVTLDPDRTDKRLEAVLELFCAMLKFNHACRSHIGYLSGKVRAGKMAPQLTARERDLYFNPRRRR